MSNAPNWAQIATAAIALAALGGAFAQLGVSRRAHRRTVAYGYFERWSHGDAVKYHAKMVDVLVNVPAEETQRRWEEFPHKPYEERLEAMLFMNFYEELGGLYNSRLVDRKVIRKYLGHAVVQYWERTSWYVDRARAANPRAFDQWKEMYDDVKEWRDRRDRPSTTCHLRERAIGHSRRRLRRELAAARQRIEQAEQREKELCAALDARRGSGN